MSGIYPDICHCARWARVAMTKELLVRWDCPNHGRMIMDGRKCIHNVTITKQENPK